MRLYKGNLAGLNDEFKDRDIIAVGAGKGLQRMINAFMHIGIDINRIKHVMDNKKKLHGERVNNLNENIRIESVNKFILENNPNAIVVITTFENLLTLKNQLEELMIDNIVASYDIMLDLFDLYNGERKKYSHKRNDKICIPKVINYFWIGNKMPQWQEQCIESWKKLCPDYTIKKWNENNYDFDKCLYTKQAYQKQKWGFVPDYARLDVIYEYGGIYLDTDVRIIKNLDDLLFQPGYCGTSYGWLPNLGNGFAAVPKMDIIKKMRDYYYKIEFINEDGSFNLTPSQVYQTEVLVQEGYKINNEYQIIDDMTVYPNDVLCGIRGRDGEFKLTQNTYSLHLPSLSWSENERVRKYEEIFKIFYNGSSYYNVREKLN